MRKIFASVAAITALGLVACSSESDNNEIAPGVASAPAPAAAPTTSTRPLTLAEILVEAGYTPKEFAVDKTNDKATIRLPGVPCVVTVVKWMDDTYQVVRVGDRAVEDLSETIAAPLSGQSPNAEVVEVTLNKAVVAGKLKNIC